MNMLIKCELILVMDPLWLVWVKAKISLPGMCDRDQAY